jgi:hypothetical protein
MRGTKRLLESIAGLPNGRVDRARRIIRGVKIIGKHSKNGRTYTDDCLRRAMPLYEGVRLYVGHTQKAGQPRKPTEQPIGWLEGVRAKNDGLYADLHYLESHPQCKSLLEAAERNPSLWCLSHNAHGDTRRTATGEEVTEILEVHSVDLVHRGATTKSLFEGHNMKLGEYLKALKLGPKKRRAVKALLEDDMMDPGMDMPADAPPPPEAEAPEADHHEALKGGFMASVQAIAGEALDGSMDIAEACKKITQLLKAHGKLASDDTSEVGDEPVEEEPLEEEAEVYGKDGDDDEDDKKPMKESDTSLRKRLQQYEAREQCRDLCESLNVTPGKALLDALARLGTEDERKALLEEVGASKTRKPVITQKPGGKGPGNNQSINDGKSFADFLLQKTK